MSKKHFPCPECGDKDLSVKSTEPTPDYVRRLRRCNTCGHRFATYESCRRPVVQAVIERLNNKPSQDWRTPTRKPRALFTGNLNDGRLCLHCGQVFWARIYPSHAHHDFTYCSQTCQHTAERACARGNINLPEALFMRQSGIGVAAIAERFDVSPRLLRYVFKEVDAAVESSGMKQTQQKENVS